MATKCENLGKRTTILIAAIVSSLLVAIGIFLAIFFGLKANSSVVVVNQATPDQFYPAIDFAAEEKVIDGYEVENPYPVIIRRANSTTKSIPKIIWTYWDSDLPHMIAACFNSWAKHASDHKIIVLNKVSFRRYIGNVHVPENLFDKSIKPAHTADWIRLAVIYEHGGIWMDASTILTQSFDFLHKKQQELGVELYIFYHFSITVHLDLPHFENYFFASTKKSQFIWKWFDEFDTVFRDYNCEELYLDDLKESVGDQKYKYMTDGIPPHLVDYLKAYVAYKKVMYIDHVIPSVYSVASETNPYRINFVNAYKNGTDDRVENFVNEMIQEIPVGYVIPPLIKMLSVERNAMIKFMQNSSNLGRIAENSIYNRFF